MDSIKEREKKLFNDWREEIGEEFCINGGLQFRGDYFLTEASDGVCYWDRKEGNEEMLWNESSKRVLILTKDLNEPGDTWDIRIESCGRKAVLADKKNAPQIQYLNVGFYRKLKRWVYGIFKSTNEFDIPTFDYVYRNSEELAKFYEQVPLVRINCKMKSGVSTISNRELSSYINRDKDFLIEQIKIYQPNVIVCCGNQNGVNIILNQVVKDIYPDLCKVENTGEWVYYSKISDVLVIDSYHPSSTINGDKWQYEEFLKNFYQGVKEVNFVFTPWVIYGENDIKPQKPC